MCKSGCGWWFHVVSTSLLEKHGFKLQQTCWWFNKFFVQILWPGWTVWRDGERDGERVGERERERVRALRWQSPISMSWPNEPTVFHLWLPLVDFPLTWEITVLGRFLTWHCTISVFADRKWWINRPHVFFNPSLCRTPIRNKCTPQPRFLQVVYYEENNLSRIDGVGPLRWPLTTVCFEENGWIEEFAGKQLLLTLPWFREDCVPSSRRWVNPCLPHPICMALGRALVLVPWSCKSGCDH